MAKMQRFGIKYPFSNDNLDNIYMDTNDSYTESIKSQVLHVIFTPKGMKLRDPDFGTNLVNYIFGPKDGDTLNEVKSEISSQVGKYVPAAKFKDINVYNDENDDNAIVVTVSYSVKIGNKTEETTVAIKL